MQGQACHNQYSHTGNDNEIRKLNAQQISGPAETQQQKSLRFSSIIILCYQCPGFESRSPRIAQARVRLATNTFPQTPHKAGALCIGYALYYLLLSQINNSNTV